MDILIEGKLVILNNKRTLWRNTYYDAGLDAKIAADISNTDLAEQATKRMKEALQAQAWLENEIVRVKGGDQRE